MGRITVCIDTNSINARQRCSPLNQLEEWRDLGLIEITRTATLTEELGRDLTAFGPARRQKAESLREGQESRAFVQRRSTLRGGDTERGPEASHWVQPITAILFSGKRFDDLAEGDRHDILHLATHRIHGWDYFVTTDAKDILKHSERLLTDLGVAVLSPAEAVAEIARVVATRIFGIRLSARRG